MTTPLALDVARAAAMVLCEAQDDPHLCHVLDDLAEAIVALHIEHHERTRGPQHSAVIVLADDPAETGTALAAIEEALATIAAARTN